MRILKKVLVTLALSLAPLSPAVAQNINGYWCEEVATPDDGYWRNEGVDYPDRSAYAIFVSEGDVDAIYNRLIFQQMDPSYKISGPTIHLISGSPLVVRYAYTATAYYSTGEFMNSRSLSLDFAQSGPNEVTVNPTYEGRVMKPQSLVRCSEADFEQNHAAWVRAGTQWAREQNLNIASSRRVAADNVGHERRMRELAERIKSYDYGFTVPGVNTPSMVKQSSARSQNGNQTANVGRPATRQPNGTPGRRTSTNPCIQRSYDQGLNGSYFTYVHGETGETRRTYCGNR